MIFETILIFLVIILFLVVSHELGHFLVAKWFGIRVDEFGIGIPPKAWGKQMGETLYSINWLPFGGFVRLFGEDGDEDNPRSFSAQSFWRRSLVVAAGVIANVIVGYLIFTFLAWFGTPQFAVEVSEIAPNSPAETSGIENGDFIIGFNDGITNPGLEDVMSFIDSKKGMKATFLIEREGELYEFAAVPRVNSPEGEGSLGVRIGIAQKGFERVAWYKAPWTGLKRTLTELSNLVEGIVFFFGKLLTTGSSPGDVIGPVGIAVVAQEIFSVSIIHFLTLIAFLSLNLAIINILPIPALDGGRLLFFVIEKVSGRKISGKTAGVIHSVFFVLLIVLLLWITYKDILLLVS
ncbi:MAG: M50 family metallopeptidase [bacterium]|nr:M50 family metallopeptidase [bacterium]